MTKSSKMQKPDLSRSHCKMLQIRGHATVDKNQLKEIESFVPKEVVKNRQMLVTGSRYKKRKATFHCILKVGEFFKAKKKDRTCFNFLLDIASGDIFPSRATPSSKDAFPLLDLFVSSKIRAIIVSVAHFTLPSKDFTTIMELPYSTNNLFLQNVEITGMKLRVSEPGQEKYYNIIDRSEKERIGSSIVLQRDPMLINSKFLTHLLDNASKASKKFIIKKRVTK